MVMSTAAIVVRQVTGPPLFPCATAENGRSASAAKEELLDVIEDTRLSPFLHWIHAEVSRDMQACRAATSQAASIANAPKLSIMSLL